MFLRSRSGPKLPPCACSASVSVPLAAQQRARSQPQSRLLPCGLQQRGRGSGARHMSPVPTRCFHPVKQVLHGGPPGGSASVRFAQTDASMPASNLGVLCLSSPPGLFPSNVKSWQTCPGNMHWFHRRIWANFFSSMSPSGLLSSGVCGSYLVSVHLDCFRLRMPSTLMFRWASRRSPWRWIMNGSCRILAHMA